MVSWFYTLNQTYRLSYNSIITKKVFTYAVISIKHWLQECLQEEFFFVVTEAVVQRCSVKKVFLKIS